MAVEVKSLVGEQCNLVAFSEKGIVTSEKIHDNQITAIEKIIVQGVPYIFTSSHDCSI